MPDPSGTSDYLRKRDEEDRQLFDQMSERNKKIMQDRVDELREWYRNNHEDLHRKRNR